jgi:hypothetical protein
MPRHYSSSARTASFRIPYKIHSSYTYPAIRRYIMSATDCVVILKQKQIFLLFRVDTPHEFHFSEWVCWLVQRTVNTHNRCRYSLNCFKRLRVTLQTKNVALLPFNYTQQKVVKVTIKATTALFISLYQPKSVWLQKGRREESKSLHHSTCLDPFCKTRVAQRAFISTQFTVRIALRVILLLNGVWRQKQPRISLNVKTACL